MTIGGTLTAAAVSFPATTLQVGQVYTASATNAAVVTATPTTLLTLPSTTDAVWLVTGVAALAGTYSAHAFVSYLSGTGFTMWGHTSGSANFALSVVVGTGALQVTQSFGSNKSCTMTYVRLL